MDGWMDGWMGGAGGGRGYFVEVGDGSLVLLEVALGAEGDGAGVAAEGALEVVDVDVEPQLRRFGKHLQRFIRIAIQPLANFFRLFVSNEMDTLLQMLQAVLPSSVNLKAGGVELEPEMEEQLSVRCRSGADEG